ncbi:hypothetical protein PR048_020490, partial [Dryococelus australis]
MMRGMHSGVQTKFKQLNPCMSDVHCLAHGLEFAVKDAVGKKPLCTELEYFLKLLYSFFHHSPVHRSILETACDNEGVNFCAPTRVGGTCWLSHTQQAVTGAIKLYPVLQNIHLKLAMKKETLTTDKVHNILEDSIAAIKLFEDAHGFQLRTMKLPTLIKNSTGMSADSRKHV